ncbi:xylulokinase [Mobilicoccus caccae]|uniref:Xylulose kinase n=1 Tax=Mobilicoccus caccae TaxID=1859295 RepID=A0ABQ6INW2_9MICO|nr:FGGY family carbohydrate kinase [Mobilicoccus caccae]GMA38388.1 xylulokinase [Mobilicoccus caccae]
MALVAGVDSSTQSCKVVVRDADSGDLVRTGSAPHPDGTEADPRAWWSALGRAVEAAGGLHDVSALSVAAQQHGMICLDERGEVIRSALLWNDTRSAEAAEDLVREVGEGDEDEGRRRWATRTGSVPLASFTVTKLRWLATHEPENAARVAAIALPHDWLTWRLRGSGRLEDLVTDRSDASGTGYWDTTAGEYRRDLLALALLRDDVDDIVLPRVAEPFETVGLTAEGVALGPGCGDNAGAALGLGLKPGQASMSLGTSGVVAAVSQVPTGDASGIVAGFADATGRYLPLACTLNASRVLEAMRQVLAVDFEEFDRLALSSVPGAQGLVHIPYLEGERTPNLPRATGSLHGMTLASMSREHLARAAVEGLLCHVAECLDGIVRHGVPVEEVVLIGGAARSEAVRELAPGLLGRPVVIAPSREFVADGAAAQAASVLLGHDGPTVWGLDGAAHTSAPPQPAVRETYRRYAAEVAANESTRRGSEPPRTL